MITQEIINSFIERTKNLTENEIGEQIIDEEKHFNKKVIKGNYESLLEYFKGRNDNLSNQPSKLAIDMSLLELEESIKLFNKILDAYEIHNVNRAKEYESLMEHLTYRLKRISEWKHAKLNILNLTTTDLDYYCSSAIFILENDWKHSYGRSTNWIIHDSKGKIIWAYDYNEPEYYIYCNDVLYGLSYDHHKKCEKAFVLTNNKDTKELDINIIAINDDNLDLLCQKITKKDLKQHEEKIDISECFDKEFFYKGPKWKYSYPESKITVIKEIQIENGFLKITIENITYPHNGYIVLDFENRKIIESKRI